MYCVAKWVNNGDALTTQWMEFWSQHPNGKRPLILECPHTWRPIHPILHCRCSLKFPPSVLIQEFSDGRALPYTYHLVVGCLFLEPCTWGGFTLHIRNTLSNSSQKMFPEFQVPGTLLTPRVPSFTWARPQFWCKKAELANWKHSTEESISMY
jgi:hypothetical protein